MKKKMLLVFIMVLSLTVFSQGALAASQVNYDILIPPFRDAWSREYLLNSDRNFETQLAASGGKDVIMAVCRADTRAALGPNVRVSPGGARFHLWRNNSGFSRWVVVSLNSVLGVVVTVRAQGSWFRNH